MADTRFEVIGGEAIGEKAAALQSHEPLLQEVGLEIPPTVVIASEMVQANNPGRAIPNEATRRTLQYAGRQFSEVPVLAIRSSAEGDASGNGVYESQFATNDHDLIIEEARLVLYSFRSDASRDFRRQARLGEDFALMVQPVVGQELPGTKDWEYFGPYLSGFGYSSSRRHPNGYLNVVAGIGGGVSRPGGELVTPERMQDAVDESIRVKHNKQDGSPASFYDFLQAIHEAIGRDQMDDIRNDFRSDQDAFPHELVNNDSALAQYLTRAQGETEWRYQNSGLLSAGKDHWTGEVDTDGFHVFEFIESDFLKATKQFLPHRLLETMQEIEQRAGYPVYMEWALNSAIEPVILQIAPAELTARSKLETVIEGRTLLEARNLVGHGVKHSSRIVKISRPDDIHHLNFFNRDPANEGYILIFSSTLSKAGRLIYSDCSKASALIEIRADELLGRHAGGDIVEHLYGSARQTDKFIGEISKFSGRAKEFWQRVSEQGESWKAQTGFVESEYGSLKILSGNFAVYADESTAGFALTEI